MVVNLGIQGSLMGVFSEKVIETSLENVSINF